MRSFLGLCNVLFIFDLNFERIAAPLNSNLNKYQPTKFQLDHILQKKVYVLKEKLKAPPVLELIMTKGLYVVYTDTCDKNFRCVLLKEHTEVPKTPICYCPRSLKKSESEYDTTQR